MADGNFDVLIGARVHATDVKALCALRLQGSLDSHTQARLGAGSMDDLCRRAGEELAMRVVLALSRRGVLVLATHAVSTGRGRELESSSANSSTLVHMHGLSAYATHLVTDAWLG